LSRKLPRDLIGFIAHCLAWNLEPQLFAALFLIGDCYVQTEIYPF